MFTSKCSTTMIVTKLDVVVKRLNFSVMGVKVENAWENGWEEKEASSDDEGVQDGAEGNGDRILKVRRRHFWVQGVLWGICEACAQRHHLQLWLSSWFLPNSALPLFVFVVSIFLLFLFPQYSYHHCCHCSLPLIFWIKNAISFENPF